MTKKRADWVACALACLALAGGCAAEVAPGADGGAGVILPPPATGPVLVARSGHVTVAEGATISWPAMAGFSGGSIEIPPGAVDRDVEISVTIQAGGPELEAGAVVYTFEPQGLTLRTPATVTMSYSDEWVAMNGVDESSIMVGWVSSLPEPAVEMLTPTRFDATTNTVEVTVTHFTAGRPAWCGDPDRYPGSYWALSAPHHCRPARLIDHLGRRVTVLDGPPAINVVVVHGWGGFARDFEGFANRLRESFPDALRSRLRFNFFDYPSANRIEDNGDVLEAALNSAASEDPNVVFVGHSMGGLVSRWTVEHHSSDHRYTPVAIVTIGTPHEGAAANLAGWYYPGAWAGSRDGPGRYDLQYGSAFLASLNAGACLSDACSTPCSGAADCLSGGECAADGFCVRSGGIRRGATATELPYYVVFTPNDSPAIPLLDGDSCASVCRVAPPVVRDCSERASHVLLPVESYERVFHNADGSVPCDLAAHGWLVSGAPDGDDTVITNHVATWLCGCSAGCCDRGTVCGRFGVCMGRGGPETLDAGVMTDGGVASDSGTFAPPPAPGLRSPLDRDTVPQGSVSFSWNTSTGAVRYHLMVCTSSSLSSGCADTDGGGVGIEPGDGVTSASVPLTAGTWYWAVRAIRTGDIGGWGPYGTTRALSVTPPPPPAPTLTAPADRGSITEGSVSFNWNSSLDAARYHLMVCTSSSLSSGCADTDGGGVGIEPAPGVTTASAPLTAGAWYWAVRAIRAGDVGGWGPYSATRTLTATGSAPPAPTPVSPAVGAVVPPGSTTFSWSAASGAARYHLMVCSSADLSAGCLNPDGGAVGIEPPVGVTSAVATLSLGTWYWAVRAIRPGDIGGWGAYSVARSVAASCTDACVESYVSCAAEDLAQHCVRDGTGCLVWVPESAACPTAYVCVAGPPGPGTACVNCGSTGDPCCAGGVCGGGRTCMGDGRCGPGPCPAGETYCSGSCIDTSTSRSDCGSCGNVCPTHPNSNPACVGSTCTFACASPFGNCDGNATTGCETNLHDSVTDCGICGRTCSAPASATPYCSLGICAWLCQSGYGDCDGNGLNGCETSLYTSVTDCSACGAACSLPNAMPACMASSCAVVGCSTGYGDCDGIAANGCERDIRADSTNCGVCGRACGGTESCSMGSCVPTCGAPRMMCGATCIDVTTDRANCATCGHACPGADTCAAGICSSQRIVEVGGGRYHSCARRASGAVVCWGNNGVGQLGDGTGVDSLVPVAVSGITDAIDLSVGYVTSCVIRAGGTVACWGENGYGRVGDGTTTMRLSPVPVSGLSGIVEVVTESLNTCARASGGQVYCWGDNSLGQLGDGTVSGTPRLTPVAVPGMSDATDLAVGEGFVCVRRSSGQVWCWGQNLYGELGSGTATALPQPAPAAVTGISDAVEIAAGEFHACARRATGQVVCWGSNDAGQLGVSTAPADRSASPVIVGLPASDAVELALGGGHSCSRRLGGSVYCWGYNSYGQVGDGTLVNRTTPVVIPVGGIAATIDLGEYHSCAALDTGALMCWGENANGRLGDGTTVNRSLPVPVQGL